MNDYFLYQVNKQPTRGENILDLVITTVPDQVKVETILPPQESGIITDHNCVVFNIRATVKAPVKLNRYVYDYQKANFEGLRSILQSIDFSNIIESNTDVNVAWSQWKEKYLAAIRDFVPMRKIKGKNSPPWITGDILHMIKKPKESVRRKLRTSSSVYLIAKFKQLRSTVKRMISDSRTKYLRI